MFSKHYPGAPQKDSANDPRVPVKEIPQFADWQADEFECLNLNLAVPPGEVSQAAPYPVMVWIHGGAYWFGGNFHPIYDVANLVSHSLKDKRPVIVVSMNYRLGIGGFLASQSIQEELAKDGFSGVGNFALTDQQVALEWVQSYISQFNGDTKNITIFGESAGGISVAHQIAAARPATFKRAIQMSGSLSLVANWSLERHQERYNRLCRHFEIDSSSPDALDRLRDISQDDLHDATLLLEPSDFNVYNPCDDGDFHLHKPSLEYGSSLPPWLESIMIGDTTDEGELWRHVVVKNDSKFLVTRMEKHMSPSEIDRVLQIYGLTHNSPEGDLAQGFIDIIADMLFKMQNYVIGHRSNVARTFAYHVDQVSTLDHILKGQAYHAIDLFYLFLNGKEDMSDDQIALGERMASDWIKFANGIDPWERFSVGNQWMVYGPRKNQSGWEVQSESQDEGIRHYSRWQSLIEDGLYEKLWNAAEDIAYERYRLETV